MPLWLPLLSKFGAVHPGGLEHTGQQRAKKSNHAPVKAVAASDTEGPLAVVIIITFFIL